MWLHSCSSGNSPEDKTRQNKTKPDSYTADALPSQEVKPFYESFCAFAFTFSHLHQRVYTSISQTFPGLLENKKKGFSQALLRLTFAACVFNLFGP